MHNTCAIFKLTVFCFVILWPRYGQAKVPPPWEPQRQAVESLWQETTMSQGHEAGVKKLSALVSDQRQDPLLRRMAARKLGDVNAISTTNLLQSVTQSITQDEQRLSGLKYEATCALYKLRFYADHAPGRQLTHAVDIAKVQDLSADSWEVDMLVLQGDEKTLRGVEKKLLYRFGRSQGVVEIHLLRSKVEIAKSPEGLSAALEKVIQRKHPVLDRLPFDYARERLTIWAVWAKEELAHQPTGK